MGCTFLRKYNTLLVTGTTAIKIPVIKRGVVDFAASGDWSPATGDVKVWVDGTAANITNLPTAINSGNCTHWEFILTGAELSGKNIVITITDSATKAIEDQHFIVETFGNASAMYQADLSLPNLPANMTQILGTAVSTPTVAGVPNVNVKTVNDVSTSSVTAINANQGTTQPLNFTGTSTSALVKSDMVDIAGAAVSTSVAQIGVNTVSLSASSITAASIASDAITAAKIADGAIDTATFAAGTTLPRVTLVDTTTTNTDMRGTNNALLASSYTAPDNTNIGVAATQATAAALSAASADGKAGTLLTDVAAIPTTSEIATALFVDGGTNKLKVNTDHSVNADVAISEENITDIAQGVVAELGSGSVTVVSPVNAAGTKLTLVQGDDYLNADSRAVGFTITGSFPDWTGGTATLRLATYAGSVTVAGTIVTPTGTRSLRFDLTNAVTSALTEGQGEFQVSVADVDSHVMTPVARGVLIVIKDLSA